MVVNVFLEQNSDVLKSFGVFLVSMDIVRIELGKGLQVAVVPRGSDERDNLFFSRGFFQFFWPEKNAALKKIFKKTPRARYINSQNKKTNCKKIPV